MLTKRMTIFAALVVVTCVGMMKMYAMDQVSIKDRSKGLLQRKQLSIHAFAKELGLELPATPEQIREAFIKRYNIQPNNTVSIKKTQGWHAQSKAIAADDNVTENDILEIEIK